MTRTSSIIRPLMTALTGVLVAFWLGAIGLGIFVMRTEFDEIFDNALEETTERLLAIVEEGQLPSVRGGEQPERAPPTPSKHEYLVYQVRAADGAVVFHSKDAPVAPFDVPLTVGFHDTEKYRFYTAMSSDGALFLQTADRLSQRREAVRESAVTMLIPLAILLPISVLLMMWIARRAVDPINKLRIAISEKDGGHLSPLETETIPRELRPIAQSVNLLLQRVRATIDAEREFATNSAHELRTPVAGALAQTQRLLAELPDEALKARARNIETALTKLGRTSEKLLQLARADTGFGQTAKLIDLRKVLDLIIRDYRRNPVTGKRLIYSASADPLMRAVDVDAFGIVVSNLIENAILHGSPGGAIGVSIDDDGTISIANDGPVLSAAELNGLKVRFRRGTTAAKGAGLGLAIADTIVGQMGGVLELRSPASGRTDGFEAQIVLSR
jgi:two-component system, OmpR family, sensor kinase